MTNDIVSSMKTIIMTFSAILISATSLQAQAFLLLVPLLTGGGDNPMKTSDILKVIIENTTVTELPAGTAYAFVQADGGLIGLEKDHGKLEGHWNVDSDGEACITWYYQSGSITNCANMFDLGDGKYQWGKLEFLVKQGDVMNLDK